MMDSRETLPEEKESFCAKAGVERGYLIIYMKTISWHCHVFILLNQAMMKEKSIVRYMGQEGIKGAVAYTAR